MENQDDYEGLDPRDLIEEQIMEAGLIGGDENGGAADDEIEDYSTQFEMMNEQIHNRQAHPSHQQHVSRR